MYCYCTSRAELSSATVNHCFSGAFARYKVNIIPTTEHHSKTITFQDSWFSSGGVIRARYAKASRLCGSGRCTEWECDGRFENTREDQPGAGLIEETLGRGPDV